MHARMNYYGVDAPPEAGPGVRSSILASSTAPAPRLRFIIVSHAIAEKDVAASWCGCRRRLPAHHFVNHSDAGKQAGR